MNVDASLLASVTRLKGKNECVQCDFPERYMIENNDNDRVIDIFGLVVYEILIFPQSPGYVDAAVVDLMEQINNQANPVPAIVAETIRSLNFCRRKGEGDFINYAQLLYMWIRSHFWGKCETSIKFHMSTIVRIFEFCKKEWLKDQIREQWVATLLSLDPVYIT